MARWRAAPGGTPGPAGYVEAHAERVRAAAAAGDQRAADRLAAALSWVDMLRRAHGDPEVAGLFYVFASEDARQLWGEP
jgi:hypothetical protein